jgi:hypothetical protein
VLELGDLLFDEIGVRQCKAISILSLRVCFRPIFHLSTHLGNSVQVLGQGNDLLQLLDRVHPLSDGLGMFLPGTLEDVGDSLDVAVSPRRVRGTDRSSGSGYDDEETDGKYGLLVGNLLTREESNVSIEQFPVYSR